MELRDGYAYGWCELKQDQLLVLPHSMSPVKTRQFAYPRDAEIVGRVVACVAMRALRRMRPYQPSRRTLERQKRKDGSVLRFFCNSECCLSP